VFYALPCISKFPQWSKFNIWGPHGVLCFDLLFQVSTVVQVQYLGSTRCFMFCHAFQSFHSGPSSIFGVHTVFYVLPSFSKLPQWSKFNIWGPHGVLCFALLFQVSTVAQCDAYKKNYHQKKPVNFLGQLYRHYTNFERHTPCGTQLISKPL